MAMTSEFLHPEPSRSDVECMPGTVVLEFGTPWCGYCMAAQPLIATALADAEVDHLKIEDGKGRPLGRSFRVKLWPTLVVLADGREVARVVRPGSAAAITQAVSLAEPEQP